MSFKSIKRLERGFVLTEHLGGMLFYLIMIGIAATILIKLFDSSKLTAMQQNVTAMAMSIQGLNAGNSNYNGLDNAMAIKAGVVPKKFITGDTIKSPWGTDITVGPGDEAGTFMITAANLNDEVCIKMATYQTDYWLAVHVNGAAISSSDSAFGGAVDACTGNNNSVAYIGR